MLSRLNRQSVARQRGVELGCHWARMRRAIRHTARRSSIPATAATGSPTTATPIRTTACRNCATRMRNTWSRRCRSTASGERPHATMHAQAVVAVRSRHRDIAAYLQGAEPAKPGRRAPAKRRQSKWPPALPATARPVSASRRRSMPKPAVLAGQHVDYLEQALIAYRNGRRKNVVMDGMAQLLDQR